MTQRQKLMLAPNAPIQIKLLYDEPVIGTNEFGEYYMYAVSSNEAEYSFFAPAEVHKSLKMLKRGDSATIRKNINTIDGKNVIYYSVLSEDSPSRPSEQAKEPEKSKDNLAEIMLKCYADALDIQKKLGSMIDTSRIAITLFIARTKGVNSFSKQEIYQ